MTVQVPEVIAHSQSVILMTTSLYPGLDYLHSYRGAQRVLPQEHLADPARSVQGMHSVAMHRYV